MAKEHQTTYSDKQAMEYSQYAQEVEQRCHQNRRFGRHASGYHAGGDGIGRICPTVYQYNAQRQRYCDKQQRIGRHLIPKFQNRVHRIPFHFPDDRIYQTSSNRQGGTRWS